MKISGNNWTYLYIFVPNEVSDLTKKTAHFWIHTPYPGTQSFVIYYIAIDPGGGGGEEGEEGEQNEE